MKFIGRKIRRAANAPSQLLHDTVILEQEHFQSFPEHWNVQQTEFSWKTVPHDIFLMNKVENWI